MDNNSLVQFSLAGDPGIPSANEQKVAPPMPVSANNMTGDPNDRMMNENFANRKDKNTAPRPGSGSTSASSTFKAQ